MRLTHLHTLLRATRRLAGDGPLGHLDDGALLERYLTHREDAAFSTLVDRHGAMVWAVCRGLLAQDADVEDAFQATFVALFRGARSIRNVRSLAPWLHGTAMRIARKSRQAMARRAQRERRVARPEGLAADSPWDWEPLHLMVHEEVNQLSEPLRTAFILCVLEGQRHRDVASRLGVPLGTVSARVSRARQLLGERLSSRGLAPTAAGTALLLSGSLATARVPSAVQEVLRAHVAQGFAMVSRSVVELATVAMGGLSMKCRIAAALVVMSGVLTVAAGGVWSVQAQEEGKTKALSRSVTAQEDLVKEKERLQSQLDDLKRKLQALQESAEKSRYAENVAAQAAQKAAEDQHRQLQELARLAEIQHALKAVFDKANDGTRKGSTPVAPEFRYHKLPSGFAPTEAELERIIREGEAPGYRFSGAVTMMTEEKTSGVSKKFPQQTLVFRRIPTPEPVNVEARESALRRLLAAKELAEAEAKAIKRDIFVTDKAAKDALITPESAKMKKPAAGTHRYQAEKLPPVLKAKAGETITLTLPVRPADLEDVKVYSSTFAVTAVAVKSSIIEIKINSGEKAIGKIGWEMQLTDGRIEGRRNVAVEFE